MGVRLYSLERARKPATRYHPARVRKRGVYRVTLPALTVPRLCPWQATGRAFRMDAFAGAMLLQDNRQSTMPQSSYVRRHGTQFKFPLVLLPRQSLHPGGWRRLSLFGRCRTHQSTLELGSHATDWLSAADT